MQRAVDNGGTAELTVETLSDASVGDGIRWLESRNGRVFRDRNGRRTVRFEVNHRRYFAKVHRGVSIREILKEWSSLRAPVLDARREARALRVLHAAGVAAPALIAHGTQGLWPPTRRSFVLTEDVGTQRTLEDVARDLGPEDFLARRDLIKRVASMVRRMHAAGVNHRDLYLGHVLVRGGAHPWSPEDPGELVLIDLHRAGAHRRVPERWVTKDLGCLAFEALRLGLSRADQTRFQRAYGSGLGAIRREHGRWRSAARRAQRLWRERERKGAEFGG